MLFRVVPEGAPCLNASSALVGRSWRGSGGFCYQLLVADVFKSFRGRRAIAQDVCTVQFDDPDELSWAGATVVRPELAQRQESNEHREVFRLTEREKL